MANNIYIGNRYVPIFANPVEWDNLRSYEPLTIVTYQGTSYTSKKTVPVGVALNNTEYWVATGNYNAQVETYRQTVDRFIDSQTEINGDVDDALKYLKLHNFWHNKKVCVYGDSLSVVEHNYWQYMIEIDPTIQITNRAVGGTRIQDGLTLIQNSSDLNTFDIIVVAYGTNSWANTALREMTLAYISVFNEIATKAPNSQIITIAPYYSYRSDFGPSSINNLGFSIYDYSSNIEYISSMYGVPCFNLYQLTGVNCYNYTHYIENSNGTYVHENEILGRRIANILLTGNHTTSLANGFQYYELTSTSAIIVIKTPSFNIITQRGTCALSDLSNLDLNHIAPGWNASCVVRGNNGVTGLCALLTSGSFAFSWDGETPTSVTGILIIGANARYQP